MATKEDYGALAKQILSLVGGAENVSNATHCVTRLRFNLKDESKADTDAIKGLAGVVVKDDKYFNPFVEVMKGKVAAE